MKNLIIVDLEATCWKDGFKNRFKEMETIEIGAVRIDIDRAVEIDQFDAFVKPVRNPELSEFCTGLTSIKQSDVNNAELFPIVFKQFLNWMDGAGNNIMSSWSMYDYSQFKQDCAYHKMSYPFEKSHLDIKKMFKVQHDGLRMGLARAVKHMELEFEGTAHRGIDDAINIWNVLKKLSGDNLRALIDKYYSEQIELF